LQLLSDLANDFVERVATFSCQIAKHRGSDTLEVKDVQLYLERSWDLRVSGFAGDDVRVIPLPKNSEAHKQVCFFNRPVPRFSRTKHLEALKKADQQYNSKRKKLSK
jgi:hypothetical protein